MELTATGWYMGKYLMLDQTIRDLTWVIEKPCLSLFDRELLGWNRLGSCISRICLRV